HARIKCSNPLEPPPPSTASPKQNFTIQFQPLPPKPGKRCIFPSLIPLQFIYSLIQMNGSRDFWCLTRQACVDEDSRNYLLTPYYGWFVARGFVTGRTNTSLWTVYNKGIRNYCGNVLPIVSLVKNQKLVENIFTPTTKVADHDVPVLPDEIIERELMTRADYEEVSRKALSLLNTVRIVVASEHSLILVDTKYEFEKAKDGSIMLIDE
ncbi:hypothetical protein S245_038068, partial [Arachis hypogaea]